MKLIRKGNEFKNWLLLLVRLLLLLVSSFAGMVFFAALGVNVYLWAMGGISPLTGEGNCLEL